MRKILLLNAALIAICFYSTFSYSAEYWARFYNYGSYPSYGNPPPRPRSIQLTSDEGYLVAGHSNTPFINSPIFFKIDKTGNVLSGKDFDSINICSYSSIRQTSDGGYIVAGSDMNTPSIPTFILKLDCTGNILWQKAYEGILSEDIQQTSDGGYVVAGIGRLNPDTASADDFCVLKLDKDGNILWQKTYGDNNIEFPSSIQQTKDGGYIVAGNFMYYPSSSSDYLSWVLKLDESGNIESGC